jgi:hypothetical protein
LERRDGQFAGGAVTDLATKIEVTVKIEAELLAEALRQIRNVT